MQADPAIATRKPVEHAIDDRESVERAIDDRALSKLRWRCRRGLLENDLLIDRFFSRATAVTESEARGLYALMDLADNELLDIFLGRQKPHATLDRPEVRQVIEAVRAAR